MYGIRIPQEDIDMRREKYSPFSLYANFRNYIKSLNGNAGLH